MPWIGALVGAVAAPVANDLFGGGSSGGGSNSGGGPAYLPQNLGTVDANWLKAYQGQQGVVDRTAQNLTPLYDQSLQGQQGIDYGPYQYMAGQAGNSYANQAIYDRMSGDAHGQHAIDAFTQQHALYDNANRVGQTAFDPQRALYDRTAQQVQDQVRAGQAARGIGVSPEGAMEEAGAMGNFNIDWQNQQLARQTQGMQAQAQGSDAGGRQGQLVGADMAAQTQMYQQSPQDMMMAAQVPLQAQQQVAQQPGQNADDYARHMATLAGMYGPLQTQAAQYMFQGVGQQQQQQTFNANQNAQMSRLIGNTFNSANQPGSWLNNMFSGNSYGQPQPSNRTTSGSDAGYGSYDQNISYSYDG